MKSHLITAPVTLQVQDQSKDDQRDAVLDFIEVTEGLSVIGN